MAHLERYRVSSAAPVLEGVDVTTIERREGGFALETSRGPMTARGVVICTGAYQRPFLPPGADDLPSDLVILDTRSYRNPSALPDGAVLVVGMGSPGARSPRT